jgi:hypothetical protein
MTGNERANIAESMRTGAAHVRRLGDKTSTAADRYNDSRSVPLNRVARHHYRAAEEIAQAARVMETGRRDERITRAIAELTTSPPDVAAALRILRGAGDC